MVNGDHEFSTQEQKRKFFMKLWSPGTESQFVTNQLSPISMELKKKTF